MKQLRDLITDIVERRLWPVALGLVVALVAVPVVLGRGGDSVPATPAPGAATADAGADGASQKAEVTLDTSEPAEHETTGRVRSPFKAPAIKIAKAEGDAGGTTTTPAAAPSGATSDSGASASGGAPAPTTSGSGTTSPGSSDPGTSSTDTTSGGTGTTKTKTKTTTTAPTAEDTTDTYHVSVRFGVDGGKLTTIRDIARLSPLPSVTDPFFVYLGVLKVSTSNTKRAVFIVSSDAAPNGEGACHPTKQDCESVELTVGQTAYFDATTPDGKVTQYELQLAGIHKTVVKSEAKAADAFARHSAAGAELLRDGATQKVRSAAAARTYRYLPAAGLLVRAKRKHVTARAAAAGTLVPGLALLGRTHQPGIPVWHSPAK